MDKAGVHIRLQMPRADFRGGAERSLSVSFDHPLPEVNEPSHWWRQWYDARADEFVRALERVAPGGFIDSLLSVLLHRKAVVYRVADEVLGRETGRWVAVQQALPQGTDRPILVQLLDGREMISAGYNPEAHAAGFPSGSSNAGWRLGGLMGACPVVRWYNAEPAPEIPRAAPEAKLTAAGTAGDEWGPSDRLAALQRVAADLLSATWALRGAEMEAAEEAEAARSRDEFVVAAVERKVEEAREEQLDAESALLALLPPSCRPKRPGEPPRSTWTDCANCSRPAGEHCRGHLIPCCPGKCPLEGNQ